MTRRLIVHAGMPRAGSSTVQEVLFHYRSRLEPAGLLYPVNSTETAGSERRSEIYNHKLLLRASRALWPIGRLARAHGEIARQITESTAELAVLSYEGWWDRSQAPALRRTLASIAGAVPGCEASAVAVVREPVSFLLSLYKLDVLHGRTAEDFSDYWPRKLTDPRLRYSDIVAGLESSFATVRLLDFEEATRDGRLVAKVLEAMGAPGILSRAGLSGLERHRSKGSARFADRFVILFLFAAREIGLARVRARREAFTEIVAQTAAQAGLADELAGLKIAVDRQAVKAIAAATAAQAAPVWQRHFGFEVPRFNGPMGQGQSSLARNGKAAQTLLAAIKAAV